jgi:hypothetical protein
VQCGQASSQGDASEVLGGSQDSVGLLQRSPSSEGSDSSAEPDSPTVLYDVDEFFHAAYDAGVVRSGTPDRGPKRRMRFYGMVQALEATRHLGGWVAECGCWKGLSAYLICEYIRRRNPAFVGERTLILDSFEGLSEPTGEDVVEHELTLKGIERKGKPFKGAGAYAAPLEQVKNLLEGYVQVDFVKGWIPDVLAALPDREYRFVHLDLDLYVPILGALRYFYPRLVRGGVMVSDDYGSLFFPGAKRAVDEFCAFSSIGAITNASGSGMIIKV